MKIRPKLTPRSALFFPGRPLALSLSDAGGNSEHAELDSRGTTLPSGKVIHVDHPEFIRCFLTS